ncbi:hypothetical protein EHI44_23245 [Rhizobium leguminosarum]|nr:hypothetical protein EHI44_23245 [Rhizobium leguminosarum]
MKYISSPYTGGGRCRLRALEGFMPVVMATGDVAHSANNRSRSTSAFPRAMETLYLLVLCHSGRKTAAQFGGIALQAVSAQ